MNPTEEELVAVATRPRWNEVADKYNQWSELGTEEKHALIQAIRSEQPADVP